MLVSRCVPQSWTLLPWGDEKVFLLIPNECSRQKSRVFCFCIAMHVPCCAGSDAGGPLRSKARVEFEEAQHQSVRMLCAERRDEGLCLSCCLLHVTGLCFTFISIHCYDAVAAAARNSPPKLYSASVSVSRHEGENLRSIATAVVGQDRESGISKKASIQESHLHKHCRESEASQILTHLYFAWASPFPSLPPSLYCPPAVWLHP